MWEIRNNPELEDLYKKSQFIKEQRIWWLRPEEEGRIPNGEESFVFGNNGKKKIRSIKDTVVKCGGRRLGRKSEGQKQRRLEKPVNATYTVT